MPISAINETYQTYRSTLNSSQTAETNAAQAKEEESIKSGTLLEDSYEKLFGFPLNENGSISIDQLLEQGTRQLEEFNRDIKQLFLKNGIDTSLPIQLGSQYGTGDTIVTNDHPDKEKINQLLKENPELSNNFKRISGMLELAEAAKESVEFQRAYSQNPQQAVAQYAHLFNSQITSSVLLEDGQAEIMFQRIPRTSGSNAMGYETSIPSGLAIETEI